MTDLDPVKDDRGVILGFLESIKYVGHLWPVSFLRWFVCFQYFGMATLHVRSGLLEHPYLSEQLRIKIEAAGVLNGYLGFWTSFVQDYWLIASYVIVCSEFVIAVSSARLSRAPGGTVGGFSFVAFVGWWKRPTIFHNCI